MSDVPSANITNRNGNRELLLERWIRVLCSQKNVSEQVLNIGPTNRNQMGVELMFGACSPAEWICETYIIAATDWIRNYNVDIPNYLRSCQLLSSLSPNGNALLRVGKTQFLRRQGSDRTDTNSSIKTIKTIVKRSDLVKSDRGRRLKSFAPIFFCSFLQRNFSPRLPVIPHL